MATQQREQYWQYIMAEYQASGLSGMAFCKQEAVSYHRFTYWRSKLCSIQQEPPKNPAGFVRVISTEPFSAPAELTLTLPSGISITGLQAKNIELLGAILRQL